MSTFSGLNSALSGMQAQRRGLDVTGQNIANANTDGYSRQRLNLQAVGGTVMPAIYSVDNGSAGGVAVHDVTRVQDLFLEAQGRAEHAQNAYLGDQKQTYNTIEKAFGEPSDTGIQSQFSEYWSSLHDLANNPGDLATRTQVLDRGIELTTGIRTAYDSVNSYWTTTRAQLDTAATDVNSTADAVAQFNQAVLRATASGMPANELADQRDLAVQKLSELTGATAVNQADGTISVYLGGSNLVNGATARHVQSTGAGLMSNVGTTPAGLQWADNSTPVALAGGSIGSQVYTLNTVLPGAVASLDAVANNLATTVNAQHQAGYDRNGNPGQPMFTGTTAATIAVAITDPTQVAASGVATVPPATGGNLDGSNADALANIASLSTGPDVSYRKMITDLGVASEAATRKADIQTTVPSDIDSARTAQSGVSLDEEMTNMIQYQRAYEAAGRVLTTIDSTLDTLINHTGRG
jgi:flagellar hook-associated protein 1